MSSEARHKNAKQFHRARNDANKCCVWKKHFLLQLKLQRRRWKRVYIKLGRFICYWQLLLCAAGPGLRWSSSLKPPTHRAPAIVRWTGRHNNKINSPVSVSLAEFTISDNNLSSERPKTHLRVQSSARISFGPWTWEWAKPRPIRNGDVFDSLPWSLSNRNWSLHKWPLQPRSSVYLAAPIDIHRFWMAIVVVSCAVRSSVSNLHSMCTRHKFELTWMAVWSTFGSVRRTPSSRFKLSLREPGDTSENPSSWSRQKT